MKIKLLVNENRGIEFSIDEAKLLHIELDKLFNSRGLKYRNLKLKDLNLDDNGKKEWLCKENMLFKRPIVEFNDEALVGWDEERYKDIFINKGF